MMKSKKHLIEALLFTIFSAVKMVSAQNTITLFVDNVSQMGMPPEEITIGPCDTIDIKTNYSILTFYDTAHYLSNPNSWGADCDLLADTIEMSCFIAPNEITYNYNPDYYTYLRYYNLEPSLTLLVTHQYYTYLYFINKPEPCGLVNIKPSQKEIKADIYPNPSNGNFNIDINKKGKYFLSVYNTMGQLMSQSSINEGKTNINLQQKNISSGLYFLEITNEQQQRLKMEKIVVKQD